MNELHPEKVFPASSTPLPLLAVCEHYAGTERFIQKALDLKTQYGAALDVTCDLEDGAEVGNLRKQMEMILGVLTSERYREHSVGLRLPEPGRGKWREELVRAQRTLRHRLLYVTLPKLQGARAVSRILTHIRKIERQCHRRTELPVHVLIEHPSALAEVRTIARLRGVQVLDFGIMDFLASLGGLPDIENMRSPAQFEHPLLVRAKTDIVLASLERGVIPSHNISLELKDEAIVREEARRARRSFGFRRMWSIHPMQIKPIIEEMSASAAELERAATVLKAAFKLRWAPIRHEDTLYDRASYRLLWEQLQQAKLFGKAIDAELDALFFTGARN